MEKVRVAGVKMINIENMENEKTNLIPKNIQNFIASQVYSKSIYDIGQKNALTADEIGEFDVVIVRIIFGTYKIEDIESKIKEVIDIPIEKIRNILQDVNDIIFKLLKSSAGTNLEYNNPDHPKITTQNPTMSLIDKRISGMVKIPKEEIVITEKSHTIETNPEHLLPKPINNVVTETKTQDTKQKNNYAGVDPYREQI